MRRDECPQGYTPRVLSPNGDVLFGTWAGPQTNFWEYEGRYGFMGGSTYTGKTDILRWLPWKQIEHDNQRIARGEITESKGQALYLLRETPRLREVMNRCERDYEKANPDIAWKGQPYNTYTHPNGYRITFGHMQHEEDWSKYQGWQITCLLWDELPSFLLPQWDFMDQWVRQPAGSDLIPVHRAGGNPVGIGKKWVKAFFDIRKGDKERESTKRVTVEVENIDGSKRKETVERSRKFIFAKVSDNKSVDQAAYLASFDGKPAALVKAMRDGDFGSATGDLLGLVWDSDAHVCKPYDLPITRTKFRSVHFSYAFTTVLWVVVDVEGNLTGYRELSLKNHTAEMAAERIRELEEYNDEWQKDAERGSKIIGLLGPKTCWPVKGQRGPSVYETMRKVGIHSRAADENAVAAVDQIRQRLVSRSKKNIPGLRYFETCAGSIEAVPSLIAAKDSPDEPDAKQELSAFWALVYAVMSRPIVPEVVKPKEEDWDDLPKPRTARVSKSAYPGGF